MKKATRLIALILAVSFVCVALAACGKKKIDTVEFTGSYTYKDAVSTLAANWNPHTYETNDDSYPAELIRVGLYGFVFNDEIHPVEGKEDFAGYKIIPEMAASDPVDVTEKIKAAHPEYNIPESATKGYAYTIDLNKNAVWQDGTKINADTYVYSMEKLLDSKLKNYRAADYYTSDFCIANAEGFANSGLTTKKVNSADGDALEYQLADLVKGSDGTYSTADGHKAYFGLQDATYGWLGGDTLEAYKAYFPEGVYDKLAALGDAKGYVPITDESIALLFSFTNSDDWGNETKEQLGYYISYDFTYPEMTFDKVGLFKSGEYQITLVLGKALAGFNLFYNLTSNWIVYKDLYDANLKQVGDGWVSTYNTSVETTMSYGPYKLTAFQSDKSMRFEKNDKWYGYTDGEHIYKDPTDGKYYTMYQTTAIDCQVVAEAATQKLMFLKGQLMTYGLQTEDFGTYRDSEYCYRTPSETIYFFIFNGYKEAIDSREANDSFDTAKYDLQTITLQSFRKAIAVTYDKEALCTAVSPARSGGYGLIGTSYVYDPDTGARYRDTPQAKQALCDFYSVDVSKYASLDDAVDSITGYDPVAAKALFKTAFDEALEKGYITDSNKDGKSDQMIRIEYSSSATSDFITKTLDYLNAKLTEVLVGTPFEGKIEFYESAPLGNAWSTNIKNGLSDTVLAGWSGSALNPFGITDCYTNPSKQYDAKWFNSASVNIEMEVNVAGIGNTPETKKLTMSLEDWSLALNGETVTVDGKEYCFGDGIADVETRLNILAKIESTVLQTYNYIPMLQNAGMTLLTQQAYYVVDEYNPIMSRGGIPYLKYNYDDSAWATFVAEQPDGQVSY